jgi:hypothetical protein
MDCPCSGPLHSVASSGLRALCPTRTRPGSPAAESQGCHEGGAAPQCAGSESGCFRRVRSEGPSCNWSEGVKCSRQLRDATDGTESPAPATGLREGQVVQLDHGHRPRRRVQLDHGHRPRRRACPPSINPHLFTDWKSKSLGFPPFRNRAAAAWLCLVPSKGLVKRGCTALDTGTVDCIICHSGIHCAGIESRSRSISALKRRRIRDREKLPLSQSLP